MRKGVWGVKAVREAFQEKVMSTSGVEDSRSAREGCLCGWGITAGCMLLSPERRRQAEVRVGDAAPSVVSSGTALTAVLKSLNSTLRAAGNQEWFLLVEGGHWAP